MRYADDLVDAVRLLGPEPAVLSRADLLGEQCGRQSGSTVAVVGDEPRPGEFLARSVVDEQPVRIERRSVGEAEQMHIEVGPAENIVVEHRAQIPVDPREMLETGVQRSFGLAFGPPLDVAGGDDQLWHAL